MPRALELHFVRKSSLYNQKEVIGGEKNADDDYLYWEFFVAWFSAIFV